MQTMKQNLEKPNKMMHNVEVDIQLHKQILDETEQAVRRFIQVIIFVTFAYASRANIEVLYGLTLTDNLTVVTVSLYLGSISFSLISLFGTSIANSHGFDKIALIEMICMLCGIIIESIAWDAKIWAFGYILSRQALPALILAFVAYMLPLSLSKQYTAYFYQIYAVAYLGGPIASGMLQLQVLFFC